MKIKNKNSGSKIILYAGIMFIAFSSACQRKMLDRNVDIYTPLSISKNFTNIPEKGIKFLLKWKKTIYGAPGNRFYQNKDYIYLGTRTGRFLMLDPVTGRKIKKRVVVKNVDINVLLADTILLAGIKTGKNTLQAFDSRSRKVLWKKNVGIISTELVPFSTDFFVGTESGSILLINSRNGKIIWKRYLKSRIKGIVLQGDFRVVVTVNNGTVFSIATSDGSVLWKKKLSGKIFAEPCVDMLKIFAATDNGSVYCLSSDSGSVLWKIRVQGGVFQSLISKRGKIFFSTTRAFLYSLKSISGEILWKTKLSSIAGTNPVVNKNILFIGTFDGKLLLIDTVIGKIITWAELKGKVCTDPCINGNMVITGTDKGKLYGFKIVGNR